VVRFVGPGIDSNRVAWMHRSTAIIDPQPAFLMTLFAAEGYLQNLQERPRASARGTPHLIGTVEKKPTGRNALPAREVTATQSYAAPRSELERGDNSQR
jgi:hypothetical protein